MIDDQQNLIRRERAGPSDFERFLQLSTDPAIPVLEIGDRKGGTGYIDFLRWSEVTGPKMRGTDCYGRPFLVVKFAVLDRETETEVDRVYMETFFQRYSNSRTVWQGAGHATPQLIYTMGGMEHEQFAFVNRILEGETVKISEDLRSSTDAGQKCRMMTQEESVKSHNSYF
jgi:hypothetical protein